MNLYNSLVEQLQQDEWSLGLPTYGPLTVVGWSGKNNHSSKFYVLTCKVCSSDLELFGNGYFKMIKEHIVRVTCRVVVVEIRGGMKISMPYFAGGRQNS